MIFWIFWLLLEGIQFIFKGFPFLTIFWCEISLVCHLKYPYSYFLPFLFHIYCFSVESCVACLFPVAVIRLPLVFIIIIIYSLTIFHISFSWWSFTGAWVRANLQVSSQYSGCFQYCCSLDWPHSSSSPFNNSLLTVPKEPIMIGTIVTFMFHIFFKAEILILLLTFFHFYSVFNWDSKVNNFANSFFVVVIDYDKVWPRLYDSFVCQIPIGVLVCHSLGQILGCAYNIYPYGKI